MNKTHNTITLGQVTILIDIDKQDIIQDIVTQYHDYLLNDDDVMHLCEYYRIKYSI